MEPTTTQPEEFLSEGVFTGFLEQLPKLATDWIHGGETGIKGDIRNPLGDWRPQSPAPKGQLMKDSKGGVHGDTNACTNFSGTNTVATQIDWMIPQGQIDPNAVNFLKSNGYMDANGELNLSPRFNAIMSGTTPQVGNSFPKVWDSMRHDGLVPEAAFPMPTADFDVLAAKGDTTLADYWAHYYARPEPHTIALGKQFASWFDVQYEWVVWQGGPSHSPFSELLKTSPLQIATAVCQGWNTDNPIKACGAGTAHATTMLHVEPNGAYDILDHYNPFMKQFAANYTITYAMRGVITVKPQVPAPSTPAFTYDYQVSLWMGLPASPEVKALQQGLQALKGKDGKPYMTSGVFGPFGPQTETALGRFQVDHGIADEPVQGFHFGPKTRQALTQALKDAAQAGLAVLPKQ